MKMSVKKQKQLQSAGSSATTVPRNIWRAFKTQQSPTLSGCMLNLERIYKRIASCVTVLYFLFLQKCFLSWVIGAGNADITGEATYSLRNLSCRLQDRYYISNYLRDDEVYVQAGVKSPVSEIKSKKLCLV